MRPNWILPTLVCVSLTALLAIASYPYLPGQQPRPLQLPPPGFNDPAVRVAPPSGGWELPVGQMPPVLTQPAPVGAVLLTSAPHPFQQLPQVGTRAFGQAAATTTFAALKIVDGAAPDVVVWPLSGATPAVIKLRKPAFTISGTSPATGKKVKVSGDGVTAVSGDVKDGAWSVAVDLSSGPAKVYNLTLELQDDAGMPVPAVTPVQFSVATPTTTTSPVLAQMVLSKYFDTAEDVVAKDAYGRSISFVVTGVPDGARVDSQVFLKQTSNDFTAYAAKPAEIQKTATAGASRVNVQLPSELPAGSVLLVSLRVVTGPVGSVTHVYTNTVQLTLRTLASTDLPAPQIDLKADVKVADVAVPFNDDVKGNPTNGAAVKIKVTTTTAIAGAGLVVYKGSNSAPEASGVDFSSTDKTLSFDLAPGENLFRFALVKGDTIGQKSSPVRVLVETRKPRVVGVSLGLKPKTLAIQFSAPMVRLASGDVTKITLKYASRIPADPVGLQTSQAPAYDPATNTFEFGVVPDIIPGTYALTLDSGITDVYGNPIGLISPIEIVRPVGTELPLVAPGVLPNTGPYIQYQEYTDPRTKPVGFNPGDHVETRVVRLYYFRDAHRVAQIINRDAKSWNRVNVDTRRRLAEVARNDAINQSMIRKVNERDAIQAANETRAREVEFKAAQDQLANADQRRNAGNDLKDQARLLSNSPDDQKKKDADFLSAQADKIIRDAESDIQIARGRVDQARTALQLAQSKEVSKRESWQASLDVEDKMKADQFRLEVAAMHADPDTYAPGDPKSSDPVQQVSISVLGESEIHLRGPLSGINIIREMINQIDAPTGQVRIAVHTVQINGERQEKMERVAADVQDYIDHSRFLTQQSILMLRKAVFKVAVRKAWMAHNVGPNDPQQVRDQRYLYEFFGRDFINELKVQDSEFLRTGNKLLSLNSMDTTSLASALFVIALAKNDTRQEILAEFRQMLAVDLPMMEQTFYEAGGVRGRSTCGNFGCFPKKQCFELMAQNARFQSLLGFFDAEVDLPGVDVLTPPQREFIKLAQILKSRLVTELEFKQRVMERALVEDRAGGDYIADLKEAAANERKAKKILADALQELRAAQEKVLVAATKTRAIFRLISDDFQDIVDDFDDVKTPIRLPSDVYTRLRWFTAGKAPAPVDGKKPISVTLRSRRAPIQQTVTATYEEKDGEQLLTFDDVAAKVALPWARELLGRFKYVHDNLNQFNYSTLPEENERFQRAKKAMDAFGNDLPKDEKGFTIKLQNLSRIPVLQKASINDVKTIVSGFGGLLNELTRVISGERPQIKKAYELWVNITDAHQYVKDNELQQRSQAVGVEMAQAFDSLFAADTKSRSAMEGRERSRAPLDHKKMLDMLIDEIQDKYVELLEGTRSYTANIDDYIKRLATALDDDLNTQFYYPAFRRVRCTATSWDVSLGAVETTSILTNNRTYAKVDPQATMEFDLPKRGILITEAFQGAKGLLDTYGALMQDPTFLNLARMAGGMPTSMPALGNNAGVPSIRSVLPGMSRLTDEAVMAQSGPGQKAFGTPLDALVPDPAIYKFETGTAYEVRPVIAPDGQSVNFHFNYMYTTNIREPVRADEKHLGRVKRHFIDTNVQLGNYELREISRYQVALRAARTGKGVPLLQDLPGVGVLFRPLPSAESSLQQNIILGQSTIFPTLFDLMGLRWAPQIADLDPLYITNADFIVRQRKQYLINRVFDYSSAKVDEALRIPDGERRGDLYRTQQTLPYVHPNGYRGPGMGLRDSNLREDYDPRQVYPQTPFTPPTSRDGHVDPYSDSRRLQEQNPMRPNGSPHYNNPLPTSPGAPPPAYVPRPGQTGPALTPPSAFPPPPAPVAPGGISLPSPMPVGTPMPMGSGGQIALPPLPQIGNR